MEVDLNGKTDSKYYKTLGTISRSVRLTASSYIL